MMSQKYMVSGFSVAYQDLGYYATSHLQWSTRINKSQYNSMMAYKSQVSFQEFFLFC